MSGFFSRIFGLFAQPYTERADPKLPDEFSDGDYQSLALQLVRVPNPRESWMGGTIEDCDREAEYVKRQREKFANHEPPRLRAAIMDWLDYADRRIADARRDIETQRSRRELDDYRKKSAAERDRVRRLRESLAEATNAQERT